MGVGFRTREIAPGIWSIVDVFDNHAYLIEGDQRSLLVDTCEGFGNIRICAESLTDHPIDVALTHGHYDHAAGTYWFDTMYVSPLEGELWDKVEDHAGRIHTHAVDRGVCQLDDPFALRDGRRPRRIDVVDGDVFSLGGRTVSVVGLPGHTKGSVAYLVDDARVLLSGDAVTPIMCLYFDNSLGIEEWRQTLAKMADLSFDCFYTGHHDHAFLKADLPSFDEAGRYALSDRGVEWRHMSLPEYRGVAHFCPCDTTDADSPAFRAVIERWHELPPRERKRRKRDAI